jgi:hypothetical protein
MPPKKKKKKQQTPTENELEYARWVEENVSELVKVNPKNKFEVFTFASKHAKEAGITYAHMGTMCEAEGHGTFCAAFQCSAFGCEGKPGQHIRFTVSMDRCESWSKTVVPMYGLNALWSPVLHYSEKRDEIFLFYSESRKQLSPGGDIKLIRTKDEGKSWSEPTTILTHESLGGVPKVIANRVCIGVAPGHLRLPFWTEPTDSWLRYRDYHPMAENASLLKKVYHSPMGSTDDNNESVYSGTIDSFDEGETWKTPTMDKLIKFPENTWLIENSVVRSSSTYLMYMRSATGEVWYSVDDSDIATPSHVSWSNPKPIPSLPNPNSKVSADMDDVDGLVFLALNPSKTKRAPLGISLRDLDASTLEENRNQKAVFFEIEGDPNGNFSYPTTFRSDLDLYVIYSVWGVGIRVCRIPSRDVGDAFERAVNAMLEHQNICIRF